METASNFFWFLTGIPRRKSTRVSQLCGTRLTHLLPHPPQTIVTKAAEPVSRILSASRRDGHSSGPGITAGLKRPTRRFDAPSRHVPALVTPGFLPIWSCSVWGLPCPSHYCGGGALLPHLFTLTPLPGRYILCGTGRRVDLNPPSRTLSGTLLCGVRTFLPLCLTHRERPSGPAANN